MDVEAIFSQYSSFVKKNWLPIGLATLGMIFFIYGLIGFIGSASKTNEIKFEQEDLTSTPIKSGQRSQTKIAIDIEGAVVSPGVYKLNQGAIIQDALVAAGGLSSDADRDFVAKNLNLASKLTDGAKIYIPKIGESASDVKGISVVNSSLININLASAESLDTLPGIGPVTAEKIINSRPYATINELLDKKTVSAKVFTQIKDRITAY